ncbi:PREDICTED: testis-expressed sequence 22 protein [Chinchilla lanigera]|uniref:testis-expressed sequence 22 protein n=1 Tax=Chinchilla lanigera TaxID=34839 RepID=UPI00038EE13E|nr:PREDICTED: testis-expressed sequence 22 protein [Chinchilla lanigera]XP_005410920.1 PREDICTED: testis-expressed sequence 22 protein [Chinchilla lanigera]XP_005410921.1 PREDICTED: testis-expressed sequence 22 protein [Chinchilla lanigera]
MDSRQLCSLGRTGQSQHPEECRQPSHPRSPVAAWGQPRAQSSAQQGLQTQDWVCEPQEPQSPGRHWSLSIEERRLLALRGAQEPQDWSCQDLVQVVAKLVSEDVDKDVLLPQPRNSCEPNNAFRDFLARSAPCWQNATSWALAPRSPRC